MKLFLFSFILSSDNPRNFLFYLILVTTFLYGINQSDVKNMEKTSKK